MAVRQRTSWLNVRLGVLGGAAVAVFASAAVTGAPLRLLAAEKTPDVFGGDQVELKLMFRNDAANTVKSKLRAQILQVSSATAAPSSEFPWKTLQVLPTQTVVETAAFRLPAVNAESRFLVRWVDGDNYVVGTTEVRVHPTNLLARLGAIAGQGGLGVFDSDNQLKPLLRRVGVTVHDLLSSGGGEFTGRLAIFGPFPEAASTQQPVVDAIRGWAKRGKACIWLQPHKPGWLSPSFQVMRLGEGTVVVARPELVAGLNSNPNAQLNLIHLAEYALQPARLDLSAFEPQTTPAP